MRQAGFTLVELLVAVAVIAIALGAVVQAGVSQSRNATHLAERTYTLWVAENVVARLRAERAWPETGSATGSEVMAGTEWPWRTVTTPAADADLRRVLVEVYRPGTSSQPLTTLAAYFARSGAAP